MEGFRQRESLENFFDICATSFDRAKMHNLVKSYLVHYAYVETLQAFEDGDNITDTDNTEMKDESNIFPGLTQTHFNGEV